MVTKSKPIQVYVSREEEAEAEDVIDLGAPRRLRRASPERAASAQPTRVKPAYTPNPRLYPGPRPQQPKREESRGRRRRKRVFRRPVPNARLYRPAPVRAPAPSLRTTWPPPASPTRPLVTASRAALSFTEQRRAVRPRPPVPAVGAAAAPLAPAPPAQSERRLVVTLPAATRYRPASAHFRRLDLDASSDSSTPPAARLTAMAATPTTASADDGSDGNETLSAPSELLAEFLSAIMQRQYAEALKYCRLILQYEPHNATARGFYPLLQHKLQAYAHELPETTACPRDSSSESAGSMPAPVRLPPHQLRTRRSTAHAEAMEQEGDEWGGAGEAGRSMSRSASSGSCASQSSLELDSSAEPSLSADRRSPRTDSASAASAVSTGCWESTGTGTDTDDNGNPPPPPSYTLQPDDVENENAANGEPHHPLKSESASLRRLRAQFARAAE